MSSASDVSSKTDLLDLLSGYHPSDVRSTLERVSTAVVSHAEDFDATRHALFVTWTVLRSQRRSAQVERAAQSVMRSRRAVWLLDEDDQVVAVSETAAQLVGYDTEELLGRGVGFLRADGQDWDALSALLREHGRVAGQTLVKRKDGQVVPIAYETTALTLGDRRLHLSFAREHVPDASRRSLRGRRDGSGVRNTLRRIEPLCVLL